MCSRLYCTVWVCVSTLCDICTTTKSPHDAFPESIPVVKRRMTARLLTANEFSVDLRLVTQLSGAVRYAAFGSVLCHGVQRPTHGGCSPYYKRLRAVVYLAAAHSCAVFCRFGIKTTRITMSSQTFVLANLFCSVHSPKNKIARQFNMFHIKVK